MSEDMTYCLSKDCKKTKCERHASHIKDKAIPHSFAMFDCSIDKPCKWAISRPRNGISLNGREYVCNDRNEVMLFYAEVEALAYLNTQGYNKASMEREGIEIVEMQEYGDYYKPIVR